MTGPTIRTRRTFGPTILVGLAGSVLTAVAGTREWATSQGDAAGIKIDAAVTGSEASPLVAALALVALASWGVLLVTRGQVRRVLAAVGLLASLGASVSVLVGFAQAQDAALDAAIDQGATGDVFVTGLTAWFYASGIGAVLAALAFAAAVISAPGWPAMGTKYDAPAARRAEPVSDEDMWRAIDEGRDPTS